ncbi:MAG: hypothetical protein JWR44_231 [Hymenobacter sp.]|jgi:hypothetical protein|nr:hypothetical protein [Hymenobacter sp.]
MNLLFKLAAGLGIGAVAVGECQAQSQVVRKTLDFANAKANQTTVPECIAVVAGDSTILYYDLNYNLTPPACAAIRRHTHVTDNGDFQGEASDYTIATSRLRSRLHYQASQREGGYETFFSDGKMSARGTFTHGEPTGSWEFWYPNGQRKQTLEWTGQPAPASRFRIVAAWDATGLQTVTNGNGLWQDVMRSVPRRYGGPVLNGLAQGVWESRDVASGKLLTTEVYEQGLFKGGKALDGGGRYKTHSLLEPQLDDPTAMSDVVRLGQRCEPVQPTFSQQSQHRTAPKPPGDMTSYLHQVLDNLYQTNQRNEWANMTDGQEFVIRANIDETGFMRVVSGQGGSGIVTALSHAIGGLARWHPATVDEKPVVGEVRFVIVKTGPRLNISMQTGGWL